MTTENNTTTPPAATVPPAPAPVVVAPPPGDKPSVVTFASTGDAALDMAMGYFAKHGVTPDSLAMTSANTGDFSVLNAVLQEKGAEGAAAYVAIAQQAHSRKAEAEKAQEAQRTTVLHDTMGGEAGWQAVKNYVAANATPEELKEINANLNRGGLAAKATARYLKEVYERGTGHSLSGQPAAAAPAAPDPVATATTRASSTPPTSTALSPQAYAAAIKDLVKQFGPGAYSQPAYAELQQRAQAWRG
jgi:hypothetical protein